MNVDDLDMDSPRGEAIEAVLRLCAGWLLADPDPHRFVARLAEIGPAMFPDLFDDTPGAMPGQEAANRARFFKSFGWAIASAMPLPANDFHPRKLPLPGRNEPCICGSLKKFKHCCSPMFHELPALPPDGLAAMVIDAMPRKQWAELPQSRIAPQVLVDAATLIQEERGPADACKLIEPWAALPAPWPAARAELLDLLCDLYLDLGKPRKRKQLAQTMVERGDATVQSVGWQRLSMIAADAGNDLESHEAFQRAQRLTPDDPRVAILEVTNLLAKSDAARAQQRAAFHFKRLSRLPHAMELADNLDVLQSLAEGHFSHLPGMGDDDVDDDGLSWAVDPGSPFHQLTAWVESLPAPKLRLNLADADADDVGALQADAALGKALKAWRKTFPLRTPLMLWEAPDADEIDRAFADDAWSPLLRRQPILADSFDVIDGVLLALDVLPAPLVAHLQALLLDRALQIWSLLLVRYPKALCEWGHMDNRPALRLLARRIDLDTTLRAENSFEWLQALVEVLNPHDNHGQRERLAAVYLRRGLAAQALALCEKYPDDFVGMRLLHARALLALQRVDDAARMFQDALKANAHVAKLLLGKRRPAEPDVAGFQIGSPEEARIAIAAQHDLWRSDKAVQGWLQQQADGFAGKPATPSLFNEGGDGISGRNGDAT